LVWAGDDDLGGHQISKQSVSFDFTHDFSSGLIALSPRGAAFDKTSLSKVKTRLRNNPLTGMAIFFSSGSVVGAPDGARRRKFERMSRINDGRLSRS